MGRIKNNLIRCGLYAVAVMLTVIAPFSANSADKLWTATKQTDTTAMAGNKLSRRCLTPVMDAQPSLFPLERKNRWALPRRALSPEFDTTINILVLRFNFQFETVDDINTTGPGIMDLTNPLANPTDSAAYIDAVGHLIDPPPHDSVYFDAHMRALDIYWEKVSEGRLHLSWDIFPPVSDSVYTLPGAMNTYGICSEDLNDVIAGLEKYFVDCINLADSTDIIDPSHPDIDFSQYQSIFLFHAGSDRQNDIGFPETCSDMFTGFIRFGDSIAVNNGANFVRTALMLPETANQDGRATALNAVTAHEFGHQLGLVDLYSTSTFLSQLGDFALMDNNGFGTGVDFGFRTGRVFGSVPVYPSAWSRAFLGFVDVMDFRKGSDIRLVAAALQSSEMKIARIPITETEYYLIEVRSEDIDGIPTNAQVDSASNVILGPARFNSVTQQIEQTGEYDFLIPGSGMLIFHVDEEVAGGDHDGDGLNNFLDNQVNVWDPVRKRKFVSLVEADGLVNFGGFFRAGFGSEDDMFRDDRNDRFTTNSNPRTIDNTGNETHIFVTDIRRDTVPGAKDVRMDTVMLFDVATDRLSDGSPIRVGNPIIGFSPIADDLDGDGRDEILAVAGNRLTVFSSSGRSLLNEIDSCLTCPPLIDTFFSSINRGTSANPASMAQVPIFVETPVPMSTAPVTGTFGQMISTRYVAVGYPSPTAVDSGLVVIYQATDLNNNGRADQVGSALTTFGLPIANSFGMRLFTLTNEDRIYIQDAPGIVTDNYFLTAGDDYHGLCRLSESVVAVLSGTDQETRLHVITDTVYTFTFNGRYEFGPITVDINRDGLSEVVSFTAAGGAIAISVDISMVAPMFTVFEQNETGFAMTVNPVAGDVDNDGFADIVIGGTNSIYAFNQQFILKTDFPVLVSDRWTSSDVITAPIVAGVEQGGMPEIIVANDIGNLYAYGSELASGFPLNNGEQVAGISNGVSLVMRDSLGGHLGYLGGDGWFYLWDIDADSSGDFWPMNGSDPEGTFAFSQSSLGDTVSSVARFPKERFYCYENPVTTGSTTIRYFLGDIARSVTLSIYSLNGERIAEIIGGTLAGTDNEVIWNCDNVTPGVYRCMIEIEFADAVETAYTDIAIIR